MSEERTLLAETVSRLFGEAFSRAFAQAAKQAERAPFDAELLGRVEELGLPALLVAEEVGGAGGCLEDALVIARELGRSAVALPLAECLLAHEVLAAAGLDRPAGALTIAHEVAPGAQLDAERGLFRGTLANVPWGAEAAGIVVVLESASGPRVALLSPSYASAIERRANLAEEPRATLRFNDARAASAPATPGAASRLFERAALLRTGQLSGALAAALERTVAYAGSRVQFGKPIGQFQAVQQLCARMGSETAAVDCAVAAAFRAADCGDASFEIACAKLRANLAADFCAAAAHQVHGAIGFTREQDLRLFTQRLLAWRDLTARSDAQCVAPAG